MAIALMIGLVFVPFIAFVILRTAEERREADQAARLQTAEADLRLLLETMKDGPKSIEAAEKLRAVARDARFTIVSTDLSQAAYDTALDILEANSHSTAAKTAVIEIGRWHHARCRELKVRTIFDEAAMQNDILVRCQLELVKQD